MTDFQGPGPSWDPEIIELEREIRKGEPMNLSNEDIRELLVILNVALYDTQALMDQSHDTQEIDAYKEHRESIRKWIHRLSQQVGK